MMVGVARNVNGGVWKRYMSVARSSVRLCSSISMGRLQILPPAVPSPGERLPPGVRPRSGGSDLRQLIGPPLVDGFMLVTGGSRDEALELVDVHRELFNECVVPDNYPPFPGIPELLCGLVRIAAPR